VTHGHNIVRRSDRTWTDPEPGDYQWWAADEQNHWPPVDVNYNSREVEESTSVFTTGLKEEKLDEEEEVEYLGECVHPPVADHLQFEEEYYDENGDDEISIKEEDQCGTTNIPAAAQDLIDSEVHWQQYEEKPARPFVVQTEEGDKNVASVEPTHVAASNGNEAAAAVVPPAVVPPAVVPAGGVPSCLLVRPATRQLVNYWQLKHQQWRSSEAELKIPLSARDQEGGLAAVRAG
jgi:hypothetical protein